MAAKNKFMNAMKMPAIADMFSSEADRQRESGDLVTEVPLSELHPFVNHPFEVRDDEDMQKLVDSIKENGVLTNLTVRPRAEGGYEIISGHRRFHAAQLAGLDKIKVQVRNVDDDQAIIDMVDANIQREHISPMEKARALKMKNDAIKRSIGRPSQKCCQVDNVSGKGRTSDSIAADAGDSVKQVYRYIRLNELIPELQKKVDSNTLKFNPAVELSYLTPDEQQSFLDYVQRMDGEQTMLLFPLCGILRGVFYEKISRITFCAFTLFSNKSLCRRCCYCNGGGQGFAAKIAEPHCDCHTWQWPI